MRMVVLLLLATPLLAEKADEAWVKRYEKRVAEIRHLDFRSEVAVQRRSRDELRQRMIDDFDKDTPPEDLAKIDATLKAFGFVRPDCDVKQTIISYFSNEVAAFYDPRTKELWVIDDDASGGDSEGDIVILHELIHAVEDQHFDLQKQDEKVKGQDDRANALQALTEGSATFGMFIPQWKGSVPSAADAKDYDAQAKSIAAILKLSAAFSRSEDYPNILSEGGLYPYVDGLRFVSTVYKARGWKGIDEAYSRPPASTEQVLHPEKYLDPDAPVEVTLPDADAVLGKGWERLEENTLGEYYTRLFLKEHLVVQPSRRMLGEGLGSSAMGKLLGEGFMGMITADPVAASDGWGGDRYRVYRSKNTKGLALVWASTWDTEKDAQEFLSAYRRATTKRWKGWEEETEGDDLRWSQGTLAHAVRAKGKDVWVVEGVPATRAKRLLDLLEHGTVKK